eukprot:8537606-Pyramimonas_sp.AAC.1
MGRASNSATHHPFETTYRGYPQRGGAQLRTGVRNQFRGTLKRSGTLGERRGKVVRTATASGETRGVGWIGMGWTRVGSQEEERHG